MRHELCKLSKIFDNLNNTYTNYASCRKFSTTSNFRVGQKSLEKMQKNGVEKNWCEKKLVLKNVPKIYISKIIILGTWSLTVLIGD